MITTFNPYTCEILAEYEEFSNAHIDKVLERAEQQFEDWKNLSFDHKSVLLTKVAELLREEKQKHAISITAEMGKPIAQAKAEIEKCSWLCDYYAQHAEEFLKIKRIHTEFSESFVNYQPLGTILGIMPWNYPYWQVFRFAVPALMAGNTVLLKHASNVMGCAQRLIDVFLRAGFPKSSFQNLIIGADKVHKVLAHPAVKGVSLTGSEAAGRSVAAKAGKHIKKSVLELGGSNALLVMDDANIDHAVQSTLEARFQNTGQSCIAGKRLLLQAGIYDQFLDKFTSKVSMLKCGDPMDDEVYIGVLAKKEFADQLGKQMEESIDMGTVRHLGGSWNNAFFEPSILVNVTPSMPVFCEETFGPLMAVTKFETREEGIILANATDYGLGASLYTEDREYAVKIASKLKDGALFVNDKVSSHPALPFGGTGLSGYGRELSINGLMEFVNIQTVVVGH